MEIKAGSRKFRVSIFDIIVIVLVILLALGFVYYRHHHSSTSTSYAQTYRMELTNMEENMEGKIQPGDKIIDKVKKMDMGEVVSVEYEPYTQPAEDLEDQMVVESEVPERITAIVTMQADCTDDGTKIATTSGYDLAVGTAVSVVGPGYSGSGYLISMDRSND